MLVIGGFSAVLVSLIVLATVFEAGVQTVDARGLVAVSDDAKEFFTADYVFIGLYSVLFPILLWWFSSALEQSTVRTRTRLAALLFVAAGIADAAEDALLLSATDAVSEGAVDAAHVVAVPKIALFVAASIFAVIALWRAIDELRTS